MKKPVIVVLIFVIICALITCCVGACYLIFSYLAVANISNNQVPPVNNGVACTMDARMCPDGSYVGRQGPRCEFAACPQPSNGGVACTLEVRLCGDGVTYVGRVGPKCEFEPCP